MKLLKNYVKVFDLEEGQILVKKGFDDDDEGQHTIEISCLSIVDEVYCTPSCCVGYNDQEKRDNKFDEFDGESAQNILQMFKDEFGGN